VALAVWNTTATDWSSRVAEVEHGHGHPGVPREVSRFLLVGGQREHDGVTVAVDPDHGGMWLFIGAEGGHCGEVAPIEEVPRGIGESD
jgi:hypothetical protein